MCLYRADIYIRLHVYPIGSRQENPLEVNSTLALEVASDADLTSRQYQLARYDYLMGHVTLLAGYQRRACLTMSGRSIWAYASAYGFQLRYMSKSRNIPNTNDIKLTKRLDDESTLGSGFVVQHRL